MKDEFDMNNLYVGYYKDLDDDDSNIYPLIKNGDMFYDIRIKANVPIGRLTKYKYRDLVNYAYKYFKAYNYLPSDYRIGDMNQMRLTRARSFFMSEANKYLVFEGKAGYKREAKPYTKKISELTSSDYAKFSNALNYGRFYIENKDVIDKYLEKGTIKKERDETKESFRVIK